MVCVFGADFLRTTDGAQLAVDHIVSIRFCSTAIGVCGCVGVAGSGQFVPNHLGSNWRFVIYCVDEHRLRSSDTVKGTTDAFEYQWRHAFLCGIDWLLWMLWTVFEVWFVRRLPTKLFDTIWLSLFFFFCMSKSFAEEMYKVLSPSFFVQFGISGMVLCSSVYLLTVVEWMMADIVAQFKWN